jgi:hypothetical protein
MLSRRWPSELSSIKAPVHPLDWHVHKLAVMEYLDYILGNKFIQQLSAEAGGFSKQSTFKIYWCQGFSFS